MAVIIYSIRRLSVDEKKLLTQEQEGRLRPTFLTPEQERIAEHIASLEEEETKEFLELNKEQFLDGKRQILQDPLARLLNCTSFIANVDKMWGRDYKGDIMGIHFYREYPQKRVMVDDFETEPDPRVIEQRRIMCASHGYIYLYSSPLDVLDHNRLEVLIALSREVMRSMLPDHSQPSPEAKPSAAINNPGEERSLKKKGK